MPLSHFYDGLPPVQHQVSPQPTGSSAEGYTRCVPLTVSTFRIPSVQVRRDAPESNPITPINRHRIGPCFSISEDGEIHPNKCVMHKRSCGKKIAERPIIFCLGSHRSKRRQRESPTAHTKDLICLFFCRVSPGGQVSREVP